ncbi:hypothetical protein F2P56_024095 [Juglans regia]|uniref:Salicylate carboxymethyltransferase-like n=2 Tax=Juglans regia TaxID=51240 RepID=A0A833U6G5_JUGRE|nr:salicylate carboxymethyltransferase-like [Juglans regia]KAF5454429.1 hypothetical protein F2P56_024095 [Juglans regia]
MLEGDALNVVKDINSEAKDWSSVGLIIQDIKAELQNLEYGSGTSTPTQYAQTKSQKERVGEMEIMNAGMGETSYAMNSKVQLKVISMTMPIMEEAITNLYYNASPRSLVIADLGCSSGPNTLFAVSELIKVVEKLRQQQGQPSAEYQVFLNDLPENDFNVIFNLLPSFHKKFSSQLGVDASPCFISGVPGSFYGRLFLKKSLHFTFSSYSLHWLSQVPEFCLENNKRSIYISSTSPPNVAKAYYVQFQKDFSMFLKSRADELVEGGRMVLTFMGRKSENPSSKECCYIWEVLAIALSDMVDKGLIGEEKLDSFNLPHYAPSASEVKSVVLMENSFSIDRLEVTELKWSTIFGERNLSEALADSAMCVRAVAEPFLVSHFGDAIIEEVFRKYKEILAGSISKESSSIMNVTISLTKKG